MGFQKHIRMRLFLENAPVWRSGRWEMKVDHWSPMKELGRCEGDIS